MSDRKAASVSLRPRGQQTPGEVVGGLGVVVKEAGKVEGVEVLDFDADDVQDVLPEAEGEVIEAEGDEETVVEQLGSFTRIVMLNITADGMEVNKIKSLVSASSPAIADKVIGKLGSDPIDRQGAGGQELGSGAWSGSSTKHCGPKFSPEKLQEYASQIPSSAGLWG